MTDLSRPRSPLAAGADLFGDAPIKTLPAEALAAILEAHELYVQSAKRSGARAHLDSCDLRGQDFGGRKLWRVRMGRADLAGANFAASDLRRSLLIGAKLHGACLAAADLTRARLSGVDLTEGDCAGACFAEAELEFAIMARPGAGLRIFTTPI